MKPSKKCPNCQSRKIAGPHRVFGRILVGIFTEVQTDSYTCVECGYARKFVSDAGKIVLKKKGTFTLNPPNPEVTHCPVCETKFKENSYQCHKCGFERDFEYLDIDDEF